MENNKPKAIQEILAQSPMTLGTAKENLLKAIDFHANKLTDEKVVSILLKAKRSLEVALNDKIYRDEITKVKKYPFIDHKKLLSYFYSEYPKMFGTIQPHIYFKENVSMIAAVLSRDIEACAKHSVDADRGILLYGGVGVGKTSIMKCFAFIFKAIGNADYTPFRTVNTIEIANAFKTDGAVAINRYTNLLNEGQLKNAGWFFDDMGNEDKANNYGNSSNVLEEIVQIIYNKPLMKGSVHFSTNLTEKDMITKYGERVVSRIKALTNVVKFPANALDMRIQ